MTGEKLQRPGALWTLYGMVALYAYLQTGIGPAIPLLRQEFHFDYTLASLHASAFAAGMVLSGLLATRLIAWLGVHRVLWGGQLGVLLGFTGLVLAPNAWFTLSAIFVAAVTGTACLAAVQASISVLAGPRRSQALLEANIASSLTSTAAPVVLLAGTALGTGWRTLWPVFVVAALALVAAGFRPVARQVPDVVELGPRETGRLPRAFFAAWLFIVVGVSVEWCLAFFATSYLKGLPGGSDAVAMSGAVAFQLAAVAGRLASSRLTQRIGEGGLLLGAIVVAGVGFPLYWSLASPALAIGGLALCGLAVALFYPLGLSRAIGVAGTQTSKASALSMVGSGSAILLAPFGLGLLADNSGLATALLTVPVGLVVLLGLLGVTRPRKGAKAPR